MKKISTVLLALAIAASLGTACKSKATCESAVAHKMEVMPQALKDMMKADAKDEQIKKGIAKCKADKVSQAALDCIVASKDMKAIMACESKK